MFWPSSPPSSAHRNDAKICGVDLVRLRVAK
jgi:hypothetical protein